MLAALLLALVAFVVIRGFVWPLVSIQFRLARNGKVAQQLVESLEARFPGAQFGGVASYEQEVIYILVRSRLGEGDRREVAKWLRQQKAEQKIAPRIELRFRDEGAGEDLVIR
jgi:hypothetical protein